jgi:hypothetical protein
VLLYVSRRWIQQQVLWLDVAVNRVVLAKVLQSTGNLLEKVASQDSMQTAVGPIGISVKDITSLWQSDDASSTLHECSKIWNGSIP